MNKLENIFVELNSIANNPKVYLVNYFETIRSQIDIECQLYLNSDNVADDLKEKAIEQQTQMINEIALFERRCLLVAEKDLGRLANSGKLNDNLKNQNSVKKMERECFSNLYRAKKLVFLNEGIIFLSIENLKKFFKSSIRPIGSQILFGCLFIIEDEFLIFSDKVRQILNAQIIDDWCNESLLIHLTSKCFENKTLKAVNRIQINMSQQKELIFKEFNLDEPILKNWFIDLSSLKIIRLNKCNLRRIDRTTFQSLIQLEVLDLAENSIKGLDSNLFTSNKNLSVLNLSENRIESLDRFALIGLGNLTQLNLSFNFISEIPEEIFKDLVSLKTLYLRDNQIDLLNPNAFKGLCNLTQLNLNLNRICSIPSELFQSLVCLKLLNLSENRICSVAANCLHSLKNLTELYLYNNCINTLPDGLFQNLISLEYLFLERNQLKFSDEKNVSFFKGLVNLSMLNLNNNSISVIPYGLFQDLGKLKLLNLSGNRINFMDKSGCQQGPSIFKGLSELIELRLNNNSICVFPSGLFHDLVNLKFCDLENNKIGTSKVIALKREYGEKIRI